MPGIQIPPASWLAQAPFLSNMCLQHSCQSSPCPLKAQPGWSPFEVVSSAGFETFAFGVGTIWTSFRRSSSDLMALPSNAQVSLSGSPLPFFSPFPVVGNTGVNLFAQLPCQHLEMFSNPYVFPPIILIPEVLRYLCHQKLSCTMVVPDISPRRYWWPLLQIYDSFYFAVKGSRGVVLAPSSSGFSSTWPLPWDLWVFRIAWASYTQLIFTCRSFLCV